MNTKEFAKFLSELSDDEINDHFKIFRKEFSKRSDKMLSKEMELRLENIMMGLGFNKINNVSYKNNNLLITFRSQCIEGRIYYNLKLFLRHKIKVNYKNIKLWEQHVYIDDKYTKENLISALDFYKNKSIVENKNSINFYKRQIKKAKVQVKRLEKQRKYLNKFAI